MNYKWQVFLADLSPAIGSEQRGERPIAVVSDEDFNAVMPVVTVLPITSLKEGRRVYPNEVLLKAGHGGLRKDSIVLAHQIRTVSKARLKKQIGNINDAEIKEAINDALRIHLNL